MPRPTNFSRLSIAQIEKLLASRRGKLASLERERKQVLARLAALDAKIAAEGGRAGSVGRGRARNALSLVAVLEQVLGKAGKPLRVGDITDAVLKTGYRTTSAGFRSIVNQTLIKQKQFTAPERGLYTLKK